MNFTSLFNTATPIAGTHRVILQTLNKYRNYDGRQLFYALENFEGTEAGWDAAANVFGQDHVDMALYDADPDAALDAIRTADGGPGRLVGYLSDAEVIASGQPRLEATVNFTDPDVERRYDDGELSLSTGFRVARVNEDGTLEGKVRPHHVLFFVQDRANQPRDQGAMLLNKEPGMDEIENAGRELSARNIGKLRSLLDAITGAVDGLAEMLAGKLPDEVANQDAPAATGTTEDQADPVPVTETPDMNETEVAEMVQKATAEKDVALTQKDAEIANLREQLATHEQAAKDATWTAIKNTLPVGWTDTADKEQEIRAMAETRPLEFAQKLATMPRPDPTKTAEQGAEFANKEADESLAITRELRTATGTLR